MMNTQYTWHHRNYEDIWLSHCVKDTCRSKPFLARLHWNKGDNEIIILPASQHCNNIFESSIKIYN